MSRINKLRWVYRLLRSRHFVLLTDKGAVINLEGKEPESFNDLHLLLAQQSELSMFQSSLGRLIVSHRQAVSKIKEYNKGTHAKTISQKRKPGSTAPVVQETTKPTTKAK